jgi:alkylhydroperoxidase family enzyme
MGVGGLVGIKRVLLHAANGSNLTFYDRRVDLAEWLDDSDALDALDAADAAAWKATDQELLAVCRDRVAMLLGHTQRLDAMSVDDQKSLSAWSTSEAFTARERAALDFTEQYVVDVASMSNDQADALREHLGDEGLVSFVNALLVIEQRMTLELAFEGVLR